MFVVGLRSNASVDLCQWLQRAALGCAAAGQRAAASPLLAAAMAALYCVQLMHAATDTQRHTALVSLSALSSDQDGPELNDLIRGQPGCLEVLCAMLVDAATLQHALVILGNIAAEGDAVDRARIRAAGGFESVLRLLRAVDPDTLRFAAGACMNLCRGVEEASQCACKPRTRSARPLAKCIQPAYSVEYCTATESVRALWLSLTASSHYPPSCPTTAACARLGSSTVSWSSALRVTRTWSTLPAALCKT